MFDEEDLNAIIELREAFNKKESVPSELVVPKLDKSEVILENQQKIEKDLQDIKSQINVDSISKLLYENLLSFNGNTAESITKMIQERLDSLDIPVYNGRDGIDGKDGKDGKAIVFLGVFDKEPIRFSDNNIYRNYVTKTVYIARNGKWEILIKDGLDGKGGVGGGENNTINNIGVGEGLFKDKIGQILNLKSLSGVNGTEIISSGDTILVDTSALEYGIVDLNNQTLYLSGEIDKKLENPVDYIDFNTSATMVDTPYGRMFWNDDDKTVNIVSSDGTIIQVGQETIIRVTNRTGSTIPDGTAVYIDGVQGDRPTIVPASVDNFNTAKKVIAITTQEIANNNSGSVTVIGLVRDVDTSSFTAGDELWLSTGGTFTNTEPDFWQCRIRMGYVIRSHATEGIILATINVDYSTNKKHYHGVYVTSSGEYESTVTYDYGTRTFTVNSDTTCWENGTKFIVSGGTSVQHDTTEGYRFIVANTDGSLELVSSIGWDLINRVGIAFIYYDTSGGSIIGEERHHYDRSPKEHINMHHNIGTQVRGTFPGISSYTLGSSLSADLTYSISGFNISDEEIISSIDPVYKNDHKTIAYNLPSGLLSMSANEIGFFTGPGNGIVYNNGGVLTVPANNSFINYYVVSTPAKNSKRIIIFPGRTEYSTLDAARPLDQNDYPFTTRDIPEYVYLYKIIYKRLTLGTYKCNIAEVVKMDKGVGAVSTPPVFTNASSITFTPVGTISATNVQTALQYVDERITSYKNWNTLRVLGTRTSNVYDYNLCNTSATSFFVYLPPASSNKDYEIGAKKISSDANTVTISAASLIDFSNTLVLSSTGQSTNLISDGSQWWVV